MSRHDDERPAPRQRDERPRDPQPAPRRGDDYREPETEAILRRVIDIIEGSPGLPMSASVRINREEVLELLDDAVTRLPDELRSARWLLKEREELRARAQREYDDLIAQGTSRVAQMAQRSEQVKAAETRAAQILEEAEASARRMRRETEDYCDQKLASFENVLAKVARSVAAGRDRLAAPTIEEAELGGRPGADAAEAEPAPVFDQDR